MKILCLMGLFPKEYEQIILDNSICGIQNAANKFQWGIIKGFDKIPDVEIKILNSLYIGSYPQKYKKLKIPSFSFSHKENMNDINVGFTNLIGYKHFSRYFGMKKEIDKWLEETKDDDRAIIAYAMTSPMVELLNYVKTKYTKVHCCLVVPDLPEYMSMSAKKYSLYSFFKKIQIRHFKKVLRPIDSYVLLTEYMSNWFDWDIKYIVVEGICSAQKEDYIEIPAIKKTKSIIYAGAIEEKYGCLELVKAFMQVKDDEWTLELFGEGSSVSKIKELTKIDPRIHLMGVVPNDQICYKQKYAEILINPRSSENEFTKYSFPSKVIEYMSSGTPMIAYNLPGMPDEYSNYFYEIKNTSGEMVNCIQNVISLSSEERIEKGKKAFDFVVTNKNAQIQCSKILNMICKNK